MSEHLITELASHAKSHQKKNSGKLKSYPSSFKKLVVQSIDSGLTIQQVSKITGISWATIRNWHKKFHYQELRIESAHDKKENVLVFRYPNGLTIEIADQSLTPDLIQLLKGA